MMLSFKDKTFCASPNCKNECGRQLTSKLKEEYERVNGPDQWDGTLGICYGYFCGKPLTKE